MLVGTLLRTVGSTVRGFPGAMTGMEKVNETGVVRLATSHPSRAIGLRKRGRWPDCGNSQVHTWVRLPSPVVRFWENPARSAHGAPRD